MIVRLQPNPNLLVRHNRVLLSKERNVKRSGFSPPALPFVTTSATGENCTAPIRKAQASIGWLAWTDLRLAQKRRTQQGCPAITPICGGRSSASELEARPAPHFAVGRSKPRLQSTSELRSIPANFPAGKRFGAETTCAIPPTTSDREVGPTAEVAPAASCRGYHSYLMTLATTPAPTVRPPSRMAKRRPSSIAIGWISSTVIFTLSPGITISTPSGKVTAPVTSVVRK